VKNSLRVTLTFYLAMSMCITIITLSFVLWNSLKLQTIADERFEEEQYFQELQKLLADMQPPLQDYLTSWSSSSLSRLLFIIETIKEKTPEKRPIFSQDIELMKREIYFLIDAYLNQVHSIVEQKRGRKVSAYTSGYVDLTRLHDYIINRINEVSLHGFRVQLEEYRNFLDLFRKIQMNSLLQILAATALAFSLLMRTVNNITDPMLQLSIMAGKLSSGSFNIPDVHFTSVNEVNQVAEAFNTMKSSIRHYIEELQKQTEMEQQIMQAKVRNLKMEHLLKRMELYTMQAQMNPHFLFNTLNTGVQLAIVERADKTAEFMENLATLFRYNLREKKLFVPLRYELEGLKTYYAILQIRFPKSLNLELEAQEILLDKYLCPAMIIQPLVENSVLHAFKGKENKGSIKVAIGFEDPVLTISVKDNGAGIPEETVRELLTPHSHDYQLGSKVMGLENVIQRCYFFYPDQKDVINIISSIGNGTEILIRINTEVKPCIEL